MGFRHVISDIQPYKSMVDGSVIKSRKHHREHLKEHGLFEVGNERVPRKRRELDSPVEDIKRAFEEVRSR